MFDKMISKSLIEWIWVGASAIVAIVGLVWILDQPSPGRFVIALAALVLYLGLIRVAAEAMIVIFNIDENLRRIRIALEQSPPNRTVAQSNATPNPQVQYRTESNLPSRTQPSHSGSPTSGESQRPASITSSGVSDSDAPKNDNYHDRMMAVRDQLQKQVRDQTR